MSQPEIPDNNLPVYLQQYDVNVLNTDQLRPCNDQSCVSTERGCCPDNVTPVPPSGECEIGGCAGTEFGCCPFSTEAKADPQGSNCGTIAGSVLYTTVGAIPSNEIGKRVWQLDLSGSLKAGVDKYYIVYDFQNVNYKYKDTITFENQITGTFNICGRVLDASKYLDYEFCDETLLLTIIIDTKHWDFRLKKEVSFSYSINVDDSSCPEASTITTSQGTEIPCVDKKYTTVDVNSSVPFSQFVNGVPVTFLNNPPCPLPLFDNLGFNITLTTDKTTGEKTAEITSFYNNIERGCGAFQNNNATMYVYNQNGYTTSVTLAPGSTTATQKVALFEWRKFSKATTYCYTLTIDGTKEEVNFSGPVNGCN